MKNLLTIVLLILGFLFIGFVEDWRVEIGIEEKHQVLIGLFYWTGALVINFKNILSAFKKPSIFNDPELKKIDREIQATMDSQVPYLLKVKREEPETWAWMVKAGLVPKDFKGKDSIDESTIDPQIQEKNKS